MAFSSTGSTWQKPSPFPLSLLELFRPRLPSLTGAHTTIDDDDPEHASVAFTHSAQRKPPSRLKKALWGIVIATALILSFKLLLTQLRRFRFRSDLTKYDTGFYGFAPTKDYHSFDLDSPELAFIHEDARCSRDYLFFAPNGDSIPEPGPVILDADGELVWRISEGLEGVTQDFRVQSYKNEDFLTFWVGNEIDGRKQGYWYMVWG